MEFIKNRMAIQRYYRDGQLRIRTELLYLRTRIQEGQSITAGHVDHIASSGQHQTHNNYLQKRTRDVICS